MIFKISSSNTAVPNHFLLLLTSKSLMDPAYVSMHITYIIHRAAVGPDRSRSSLNLQNLELCTNAVEHHNGQLFLRNLVKQ